jgi:chromosome segregation protein
MVYIKRIDLRGFKTFGKKATVHLDRGLTIITGPNGSGKSNILDSVKFALGELSPKELRGETIGDLIHKSAGSVSPRSAWVAVQFDNHDRRIPIDAEAVTVSREFRRGGEGIYRLNGKRISRKQLTDIFSSADIQVSSYNIVPQHAITRLAEVTSEERRRIIEDMIGIAVYDVKKTSAQTELQQADVNLQVASAKIEEVRLRVEALEKERNDYLKYTQVRAEINQLEAKALSHRINKDKEEARKQEEKITEHQQQLQQLKGKRDELLQQKSSIESERRDFEDSVAEKSSNQLLEIQTAMGDTSATIAKLRARADAISGNVQSLETQKKELEGHSEEVLQRVATSRKELHDLKEQQPGLLKEIAAKQTQVDASAAHLAELREKLGENNREAEDLERSINTLAQRLVKFNAQTKASATKIELLQNNLGAMSSRKEEHEKLLQSIEKHMEELDAAKRNESARLTEFDKKIAQYKELRVQRDREIQRAMEVAKRSGSALVEIETQKNLADSIASEEKALGLIEKMVKAGSVSGIYGRLFSLVKIKEQYAKAVEAASAGWMKALVVKDIETAVACIEVLKKAKVGRIKLIPLENLSIRQPPRDFGNVSGTIGPISDQLVFDQLFSAAVQYVFGDTVLTSSQKTAFLASLRGIRAVAVTGDLYEPGGAMETGYYRQPFDISKLLLTGRTVEQLRVTLSSLEGLASRAREDISRLDQESTDISKSSALSQNLIRSIDKEIVSFTENLQRARRTITETNLRIEQLGREIVTEQIVLATSQTQKAKIQQLLASHEENRSSLKIRSRSATILEKENEHSKLNLELNDLLRRKIELESRIESLGSAITIIEPSAEQTQVQGSGIDKRIEKLVSDLTETQAELSKVEDHLKQLESNRSNIMKELGGVKTKRGEYDSQLTSIDSQITVILDQLDPLNDKLTDLGASAKHGQMQIEFHMNQLKELGFTELVEVTDEEIAGVEKTLPILKKELAGIGGVNELAASQYEEVKENYKHLASRIYGLENEKLSIIKFMNELDKQKFDAFMKAFNQVSQSFNEIFSTVTGGVGRLFLEKPETPFEGGADIRLQFPGKTEMTIGSASGGEKSVGTVCFILALQAIHPMPFYMMDEIDAHLDVVNSQRLAELLRAKSKGSQFIIVSLKDVTIARADSVYGVFIQEGTSQVVGLPMQTVKSLGRTK